MPALSAPVTAYIDGIIDNLNQGNSLGSGAYGAAQHYLRAQDMATILDLLVEAVPNSASLTATGGSTTTCVVTTLEPNLYPGATITFDPATTTVALQGTTHTVASNDATTLTVTATMPAACAAGDTFVLSGHVLDDTVTPVVSELRGGRGRGDAPPTNVYGLMRKVADAFEKIKTISGSAGVLPTVSRPGAETIAGSTTTQIKTDQTMRIDEMQGLELHIAGEVARILSNNETDLYLKTALVGGAPAAATAYEIKRNPNTLNDTRKHTVHPGGHPDNRTLAYSIDLARDGVVAIDAAA